MLKEWELWACADEAIRQHGLDAPIFAVMGADKLLKQGDQEGARAWRLIVARIHELLAKPPGAWH